MKVFLGVDVGSVSTNIVGIDENNNVMESIYVRTSGNPIEAIKTGMKQLNDLIKPEQNQLVVSAVGATGSGRNLAGIIVGADTVKNEITAHAIASLCFEPGVRTILEIGGQDSKIILLEHNVIKDFAMNTVCAAGTGSFLDRQAERLGVSIESFGELALKSELDVRIAGRCAVFAESDMIHKQQMGFSKADIVNGLCDALVRNYLNNVGKGKDIKGPIIFQGGVASNIGIKKAFERALNCKIKVPRYHKVMGALGVAIIAKENMKKNRKTNFLGFELSESKFEIKGFECSGCPNICEVAEIYKDHQLFARWGDKCGKWHVIHEKPKLA